MRNLSYENEFYSQVHSNANHTHFHMKDFTLGLGLKQRQKATQKWPIECREIKTKAISLAPVVQRVDSVIHWIRCFSVDEIWSKNSR